MQALPSLQPVPSPLLGLEQLPVAPLQTPALWHWSDAVHVTGLLPVQTPVWQLSTIVQRLPSLHVTPFVFAGFEQVPVTVSQMPALWHWSDAEHVVLVPPVHVPA